MAHVSLKVSGLRKVFNRRTVFSGIDFQISGKDSLTVTGRNGSGKSTLLKIIAGVLSPTRGNVDLLLDQKPMSVDQRYCYIGFVAPYLQLYDEFSAVENLEFFSRVRGLPVGRSSLAELLARLGLQDRKEDPLRTFSSGMKQRVKYAFALLHDPPVLLLDEPTANLDAAGMETVYRVIEEQKQKGIVIVATNNADEIHLCRGLVDLDAPRPHSPDPD
jgi:heme exporter protein A